MSLQCEIRNLIDHYTDLVQEMAQIVIKSDEGEVVYGTYPFNTPSEKNRVNELAMQIRDERGMGVEVRKVNT